MKRNQNTRCVRGLDMSAEDTWNKLHEKERQLSEKEWDLYQRIEKIRFEENGSNGSAVE